MAIRRPTLLLGSQLRTTIGTEADDATRALAAAWVKAWATLSADMNTAVADAMALAAQLGRWPAAYELNRIDRLYRTMEAAQSTLQELATRAGVTITDAAGNAVQSTADAEPGIVASQLPVAQRAAAAAKFAARINPTSLDIIVARTAQQITSQTNALSGEAVDAMHRELVRGVALGDNPNTAASRMVAGLEEGFNGGLARATNIARTEVLDAYRTTSQYAHHSNSDVLSGWLWLCTFSNRTCPSCIAMNGSVHDLSEPGPQDHQSGRCARVPIVKPWSELGIKTPEPPSTVPDARKWFSQQSAATQAQMLGPGRLNLLKSGRITWDDIPRLRTTSGWRPSYAPASLKDLERIAKPASTAAADVTARPTPLPRRTAAAPVAKVGSESGRPLAAELLAAPTKEAAAQVMDGTFASLTTKVTEAFDDDGLTLISGDITDSEGTQVGEFTRALGRGSDQSLVAYHALLRLDSDVQGQGFAEAFNAHLEDWYRESGVARIELNANISIGGYAWSRSGYDFATADEARKTLYRLDVQVFAYDNDAADLRTEIATEGSTAARTAKLARIEDQLTAARSIIEDAKTYRFGDPNYPTAYRLGQAGRWSGATRDDTWIGKATMLGSSWDGVKPL